MGLEENVVQHLIKGLHKTLPKWQALIHNSFLSDNLQEKYEVLILSRLSRLEK